MKPIPIIDLFAGPGGLGEGFMSVRNEDGNSFFDIKLSIEKDVNAHKTLTLRSFYRQFKKTGKDVPKEYYQALQETDLDTRERLIECLLDKYDEGTEARSEAARIELGSSPETANVVDELIKKRLEGTKNWVLIGGPPCQAYSNVGRSRVGGIKSNDHRVYLYKEYLRILEEHRPSVFVMENVKGLLSAKVDNQKVFDWIKRDLSLGGEYEIHSFVREVKDDRDYLIKSEEYGVPQARHRVILLGIRSDFKHRDQYLQKKDGVTLQSIIGRLPKVRSGINREFISFSEEKKNVNGKPKRIYNSLQDSNENWVRLMNYNIDRIKDWGELSLNGLKNGAKKLRGGIGSEFVKVSNSLNKNHPLYHWYIDEKLKGIPNHQSRSHLTQDLMRYLFASIYVEKYKTFPRLHDFATHHKDLIPDHSNVDSGKFTDRFRVQIKNRPATTITSHISKDGHYYIHYDSSQCRSLTVREAARIQTFPDNYLFRGSRTSQYHQVGNAVPPFLAFQLANIVKGIVE